MPENKLPLPVRALLCLLPPAAVLLLFLFREQAVSLALRFPACPFYTLTGLYCPACGNTRSVLSLLRGDVLSALRYSIIPPLCALLGIFLYLELVLWCCGRHRKLLPRKGAFWITSGALLLLYFIGRNLVPFLMA